MVWKDKFKSLNKFRAVGIEIQIYTGKSTYYSIVPYNVHLSITYFGLSVIHIPTTKKLVHDLHRIECFSFLYPPCSLIAINRKV